MNVFLYLLSAGSAIASVVNFYQGVVMEDSIQSAMHQIYQASLFNTSAIHFLTAALLFIGARAVSYMNRSEEEKVALRNRMSELKHTLETKKE